jgi:hypothetical protein
MKMKNQTPFVTVPYRSLGMKALSKILLALTAVAALSFAYPASVQADPITYVYTGNPFNDWTGPYSTSDFVTATVTLSSPLAANLSLTGVTPLTFSMSDGVQTITSGNAVGSAFQFATGPTGAITNWDIEVTSNGFGDNITLRFEDLDSVDGGHRDEDPAGFGQVLDNPGVWVTAVPDVGSSLALLSLSLTALGVAARQFKRAAA